MSSDDQLGSSFHVKTHVCYRGGLTGARIEERTQSFRSKMEHFFLHFPEALFDLSFLQEDLMQCPCRGLVHTASSLQE